MAGEMLPQDVADAFVKQYYAILNKCPENAHKFYQESSLLSWPGTNGDVTPVTTLSGINDKVMSSDYKNCSAEVKTVDSQASMDGGIIVAVTGSFTGTDDAKKYFSQTFFLAKQKKGFFVLNDILRFLDITIAAPNHAVINQPAASTQSSVSCNNSASPTPSNTKEAVEDGKAKEGADLSAPKETVAKAAESKSPIVSSERASSVAVPVSNPRLPTVVTPAPNVSLKVSYASMVAKEIPVTSPKLAVVASSTTRASTPLGDGAPKVSTPSSDITKPAVASLSKVAPKTPAAGNGSFNNSTYAEGRGIYIGRLPYDITKQGIVEVVKKFGPVRRNADTIQIRRHEDGFVCGFIEFESADSARRAVEAHHIKFGDKEAYITYKRSSYGRGNDGGSRSPNKGGSRTGNNERVQNENWGDQNKGQGRGLGLRPRAPSGQSREASRDRLN